MEITTIKIFTKEPNKNCVYWTIIGLYKNWQYFHFIYSIKQHESTNTNINDCIKQNSIRNISLNISKYTRDNDYGENSAIDKNAEKNIILINREVRVIHFSIS